MTCQPCQNVADLGWWGPEHIGTHCQGCHRSWSSTAQAHCDTCHRHFGSVSAFGEHFVKGEHVDPKAPRWETAAGPVWGGKDPALVARMAKWGATTEQIPAGSEFS